LRSFFNDKAQSEQVNYYLKYNSENDNSFKDKEQNEEVNDIIMKIELKKFQKLIENRIQRKNALLQNDIKRMYPMCNHSLNKPLQDEFRPELDNLKGYKLTSPKEEMMKS
jgi:hypothetical protein